MKKLSLCLMMLSLGLFAFGCSGADDTAAPSAPAGGGGGAVDGAPEGETPGAIEPSTDDGAGATDDGTGAEN